jgi:hypothetical protein
VVIAASVAGGLLCAVLALHWRRRRASRSPSRGRLEDLAEPGVPRGNKANTCNAATSMPQEQPAVAVREAQATTARTTARLAGEEVNLAAAIDRLYDEDERIKAEHRRHQRRAAPHLM